MLLEDDPADVDLVLAELHRAGIDVVAQRVDTRDEFVLALRDFEPDVVLSDHMLAAFNAVAALEILKALRPAAPLIVVSGSLTERTTVACLKAGADDVVLKTSMGGLAASIRAALELRQPLEKLSPRQLQVLKLVARGQTTPQIADQLRLSGKTVETHRGEIMKRLDIHDLAALVRYAVNVGFCVLLYLPDFTRLN